MNALGALMSNPVVPRIGWTLIHSLWQGAAAAALLALALLLLRRASANARYLAACAALLLMVAGPAVTYWHLAPATPVNVKLAELPQLPETPPATVEPALATPLISPASPDIPSAPLLPPETPAPPPWHERTVTIIESNLSWVVAAWFIGVLFLSMRLLVGWIGIRRMRRSEIPASPALGERMKSLARKLRVTRAVRLMESALAKTPVVIGWFRPVILFPASLLTQLSAEQLDAILAHELAHIRRHDYLVNLFQAVVETVLFYHPGVHWISRRIRVEREHCCDDLAAAIGGDPASYARALARVAEMTTAAPRLAPAASGHILNRIRRLLSRDVSSRNTRASVWVGGAALLAILLLVGAVALSVAKADDDEVAGEEKAKEPSDYTALFELTGIGEEFRAPTAEEIEKLGELWPTVPPEENAAFYFAKASKELLESNKQLPEPAGSASAQERPFAGDAAEFVNYVLSNRHVLETVQKGTTKKDFQFPCLVSKQTGTPSAPLSTLAGIRNLTRFLTDAGFAAELQRDPAAAADRYLDCIRMGGQLRGRSKLITNLVGMSLQSIGRKNLDSLLANTALTPESLVRVMAIAPEAEITTDDQLAVLRGEAAFAHATMALSPQHAMVFGPGYDEFIAFAEKELAKPLPEVLRSGEDAAKKAAEQWPALKPTVVPFLAKLPHEWARTNLSMRELQLRAAIALYEQHHGEPPENLDALVPDFLPAVPEDPFSGKPLRYLRRGGNWKLWSVGSDLKDDGGAVDEQRYDAGKGQVWYGPDYVFLSDLPSNIELRSGGKIKELPELRPKTAQTPKTEAALDTKIEAFSFEETPLYEVINFFKLLPQFQETHFAVDDEALGEDEIFITRTMSNVTLRQVLAAMLKPQGLDFAVWNDAIFISTPERTKKLVKTEQTLKTEAALDKVIEAFDFKQTLLPDVAAFFQLLPQFEGINFIVDPKAVYIEKRIDETKLEQIIRTEAIVTARMQNVKLRSALDAILKPRSLAWTAWSEAIFISTPERIREICGQAPELSPEDKLLDAALDKTIESFSFEETPLYDVVNFFKLTRQFEDLNFIIDNDALADRDVFMTRTMKNVTLRQALTAMLKPKGLDFAIWNDAILISTPERIEELTRSEN